MNEVVPGADIRSHLTTAVVEAVCQSLRVNPSWAAAADYAGISPRTLRRIRERGESYEKRQDEPDDLADLTAQRHYKAAYHAHQAHDHYQTQRHLTVLYAHLDRDPDRPYYEASTRFMQSRSRGELQLVAVIRKAAGEGDWRAALALLKAGWPERYSERLEVTGRDGGPVEVAARLADAEDRARSALDALERKRTGTE